MLRERERESFFFFFFLVCISLHIVVFLASKIVGSVLAKYNREC